MSKSCSDLCAKKKAVSPAKKAPREHVASAAKRVAMRPKTKPASKRRKSGGRQAQPDWCLNQDGEKVRPKLTRLSDVEAKPVQWLWENKIPRGNLSMIVGFGGEGKTFWTIDMTAHITKGTQWADGTPCEKGSVLFFYGEDGADTYKERCAANGVDQKRVMFLNGMEVFKDQESTETGVTVADIDVIRQAIRHTAEETGLPVKAVFIDPITNYLGKVSGNSASGVRSVLHPLQRLAEELDVAIVLIHHFAKGKKANLQQQISGSGALVECCRAVWGVFHDPDENVRYFAPVKFNCGADPTTVSFQITVPSGKIKVFETGIRKWAEEVVGGIASTKKSASGRPPKVLAEASNWLSDILSSGEMPVKDIYAAAKVQGFSEKTVDRAKETLGVKSSKRGFGKDSYSVWTLPPSKGGQNTETAKAL